MTPSTALLMDLHLPGVFGRGGSDDMEAWMSQEVTLCPIKNNILGWLHLSIHLSKIDSLVTRGLMTVGLLMLRHVDACALPKMQLSEQCHVLILRAFPHEKFKQLTSHYSNASKKKNNLHQKNLFQNMFWRLVPPVTLIQWRIQHPYRFPTAMDPVSPCACLNKTLICHSQQHLQELMPTQDLSQGRRCWQLAREVKGG